ncbi:MAG: hypothetical protein F6K28_28170 [Microcoleus sp. SIO2G3]|nr:hypothetical protein [Microcoleus sp. SIO2G3]
MVQIQPNADQLGAISALIDEGKLRASIETVLPLTDRSYALAPKSPNAEDFEFLLPSLGGRGAAFDATA